MGNFSRRPAGIPDLFYAQRVATLVARGLLKSQGDLSRMRYCEVRVAQQVGDD
ncbi:DUF3658 domain-containing protein [Lysobacter gummosus]|jgi:hypothetical protein|uniref:DUF3658 domain-containing protein n=1 Tax=Lysobacter TaxID=68 RepID=UPI001F198BA5|nr:DUF3658 domain-containing protein [Lysobacter capsici]UJQ27095.1 DUF3658 domain-containing protein [Lysobacter gummosus]